MPGIVHTPVAACPPQNLLDADGEVTYHDDLYPGDEARQVLTALQAPGGVDWSQRSIRMFGREVQEPRLTAWYGDPGCDYRYSGLSLTPLPWTSLLAEIRDRAGAVAGVRFNSVLANLYRDGFDHMGWHSDDEPELGPAPVIASVSFGASRRFQLRPRRRDARDGRLLEIEPTSGSLIIMRGRTQQAWQHRLMKSPPSKAAETQVRINLTFRCIY